MDKHVVLNKKDFGAFISELTKIQKVVAPISRGYDSFSFEEIKSSDEISLEYLPTILPPKKYFMPQKENILKFNKSEQKWDPVIESEDITVFGVHSCDLAGIQCLNIVFNSDPEDINYNTRKKNILIIGLECNDYCDEYASCAIMDNHLPNGGYDLFFTDLGDYFIVHIGTQAGEELANKTGVMTEAEWKHNNELEVLRSKKRKIFQEEVNARHKDIKQIFEKSFDNKVWDEIDEKCVSCGNCTNVCPTCYCFDIQDEIDLNLNTGVRVRSWDSCQNEKFAEVAGGENFREERKNRQKHRYMRKFNYPVDKYKRYFCTGCGRCSRTCMAKINLKETINTLI